MGDVLVFFPLGPAKPEPTPTPTPGSLTPVKSSRVFKLQLSSDGQMDLNDPQMKAALLKKVSGIIILYLPPF